MTAPNVFPLKPGEFADFRTDEDGRDVFVEKGRIVLWPDAASVPIISKNRARHYRTIDGTFPSVTSVLRVLGLSTDALVAWAGRVERAAVLDAAAMVYAEAEIAGPNEFVAAVEERIGEAKQHQKLLTKAGEVGSLIHAEISRRMNLELGLPAGPPVDLPDAALVGVMSWEDWWRASGYRVVRTEQPVWSADLRSAGTADLIVEHPTRGIGLIDFKSSRGVYESHHVQTAAYAAMARNWAPIQFAEIVRFPKSLDDPQFEVVPLGRLYGGRVVGEDALLEVFRAAVTIWETLA